MLTFAKNEMTLAKKQADGATLRQHLEAVARQIGRQPEQLKELSTPACPPALVFMWQAFLELSAARGSNANGPAPISYSELKFWAELTRRRLTACQVEIIKRLDAVYLAHQAEMDSGGSAP